MIGGLREVKPFGLRLDSEERQLHWPGGLQKALGFERSLEGMYSVHSVRRGNGMPRKMGFEVTAPLSNQQAEPDASSAF